MLTERELQGSTLNASHHGVKDINLALSSFQPFLSDPSYQNNKTIESETNYIEFVESGVKDRH